MASRRISTVPSSLRAASTETTGSKGVNSANKANSSGNVKKSVKPSGTVVKSRYLQSAEKTSLSKSNPHNESLAAPPRPSSPKPRPKVGTPPRRSVTPQSLATSIMAGENESMLQSTFSQGHCQYRPDFDISVIKEQTVLENIMEPERNPENDKRVVEMQTFLLAYLTAKMENNTAKLRAAAETRILQEMEEAQSNEVMEKKHKYELIEKSRLLNDLLDLQIASLTPVAEAATHFTEEYKSFATAVDTTRHELSVKNIYMDGDQWEFLEKAESCLKESEKLLAECTHGAKQDNCTSLECLKNMKMASNDISQQLKGAFSELLELSSLICRHTIHIQQAAEEERLGTTQTHNLYCPKP